jgi:methionyl-tRNA formyltransferase
MYRYAATDPRLERARYFYAPFEGPPFLAAWRETRRAALARLAVAGPGRPVLRGGARPPLPTPGSGDIDTPALLAAALQQAAAGDAGPWPAILARRFETGRVLRARYGSDLRPLDRSEVPLDDYARFAALLARAAGSPPASATAPDLGLLSTLLKVGDVLCHALAVDPAALSPDGAAAAREALGLELNHVDAVASRRGSRPGRDRRPPPPPEPSRTASGPDRPLAGVTLLAADTARARAYLSLLAADGLLPEQAILVELDGAPTATAAARPTELFDSLTPLGAALERAGVPTTRLAVGRFEDEAVLGALDRVAPDLVVVASPAGVILAPSFFDAPARHYLHVHPGRLPDYRGSTPMYYELLAEGGLTATALFLDAGIDTGSVVAEQVFAAPDDRTTIDHAFDPWMRAMVLRDVLRDRRAGRLPTGRPQVGSAGRTYFVIHPVLRHVALLDPRSAPPARPRRPAGGHLPGIGRGSRAAPQGTIG